MCNSSAVCRSCALPLPGGAKIATFNEQRSCELPVPTEAARRRPGVAHRCDPRLVLVRLPHYWRGGGLCYWLSGRAVLWAAPPQAPRWPPTGIQLILLATPTQVRRRRPLAFRTASAPHPLAEPPVIAAARGWRSLSCPRRTTRSRVVGGAHPRSPNSRRRRLGARPPERQSTYRDSHRSGGTSDKADANPVRGSQPRLC